MAEPTVALDRRQRRRQESIEEVLDVALELMAENGVAGLSLGEVARRMGIRPPSLYVYFDSKDALYDALFARGARGVLGAIRASEAAALNSTSLDQALLIVGTAMVRWSIENSVYSQLLFWRPVPGFEPSEQAYAPAVELIQYSVETFGEFQRRGWIRADVPADEVLRDWTIVTSGIVSQQLSNAPQESFETGRFSSAIPNIVAMFAQHYTATPSSTTKPVGRQRRANQR